MQIDLCIGWSRRIGRAKPEDATNYPDGNNAKTAFTDSGSVPIDVPSQHDGTFESQLIGKRKRRIAGFNDKIIAIFARGTTVRGIQDFLTEIYATDTSPDLISSVTDAIHSKVTA